MQIYHIDEHVPDYLQAAVSTVLSIHEQVSDGYKPDVTLTRNL